jgi:hypothetical protein
MYLFLGSIYFGDVFIFGKQEASCIDFNNATQDYNTTMAIAYRVEL